MGAEDLEDDAKPMHAVEIKPFCLDETEVTVAAYAACVKTRRCSPAEIAPDWEGLTKSDVAALKGFCNANKPDRQNHPINCVSFRQSDRYCRSVAKRLPTEEEWEYAAAGGSQQRKFPWGAAVPEPTLLNACGPECTSSAPFSLGKKPAYSTSDGWVGTAPVGSFSPGDSRWGARDLGGNVAEWTSSSYCDYKGNSCYDHFRMLRGGGWADFTETNLRTHHRGRSELEKHYEDRGVRCAADDSR